MPTRKVSTDPEVSVPNRRPSAHRRVVYLLLSALMVLAVACQRSTPATERWTPPYLEMHLFAGKVQVQGMDGSEWKTMEGKAGFTIEEQGQIVADEVEGAQLFLGDGSTLELDPATVLELRNPRTFPRLQVIVHQGGLLFFAQKPSYEFVTSACPVTFLSVPSLVRIEVNGERTRLAVEEGVVSCETEAETLTLPTCREMVIEPGGETDVTEFCTISTTVPPSTVTPSPSPTPLGFEPSATPTASATPTPTLEPTPTGRWPTPTPTPPPTNTPAPAKPQPTKPPPTEPPPTQPPPTQPPPTEPPPTQPPPTEPRPTPPPSTQPRPTVAPSS